jgi:hypothetical protein
MQVFQSTVFEIIREWNRTHFEDDPPSVEIQGAWGLECYCSRECLNARRVAVMAAENVPIRRPGIGPVETCAKCGGPVDMTCFHLTYLESSSKNVTEFVSNTVSLDYLAVVCHQCHPIDSSALVFEAEEMSEPTSCRQNSLAHK